ncbi:MAG: hypothetical protein SX243_04275 [Acidobacteriota bacterium]|nr:hypothetical protein [Acidobacteriota bacterium]
MNPRATLGLVAGALSVVTSAAHAWAGWPPFHHALHDSGVAGDVIAGLRVAWYLGSVAMLTFGILTLLAAIRVLRDQPITFEAVQVVGVAYFLFGMVALLTQTLNIHFLLFIVTGLLTGAFGFWHFLLGR